MTAPEREAARGLEIVERELEKTRDYARRAQRELHRRMAADVKAAKKTTRSALQRAEAAERRADRAERKLADVYASRTWRVGKAVLWLPAAVRRAARRKPSP